MNFMVEDTLVSAAKHRNSDSTSTQEPAEFRNQIDEIEDLSSDKDEKEDSVSSLKVQDQENAYDASVSDPLGLL